MSDITATIEDITINTTIDITDINVTMDITNLSGTEGNRGNVYFWGISTTDLTTDAYSNGDLYFNSVALEARMYINGVWVSLGSGSSTTLDLMLLMENGDYLITEDDFNLAF